MKGCAQWNSIYSCKNFRLKRVSRTTRSAGQRLIPWATGARCIIEATRTTANNN